MKVVNIDKVERISAAGPLFTGEDVTRQPLAPDSEDFNISVVNFGEGVRNKLHYHESDQILIVTAGEGIVATEDQQVDVSAGDVIFAPAGERHWHGARPGSTFSHVTVTRKDVGAIQLED